MFDLGMQELVVIFVVALLVFGPKRLPELGRTVGKAVGQLKKAMADVKSEVDREIHLAQADVKLDDLAAWKKGETNKPSDKAEKDMLQKNERSPVEEGPNDSPPVSEEPDTEESDYLDVLPEDLEESGKKDEGTEKKEAGA